MLQKRTQILFDVETFHMLRSLAQERKTSIGKLVRNAVIKTYRNEKTIEEQRSRIIKKILARKAPNIAPYTTSDLVKIGRKFE